MNKNIIIAISGVVVVVGVLSFVLLNKNNSQLPANSGTASDDCEAACNKYVLSCLTLVPNVSEALFDDGYKSCLKECAKWSAEKTECMITAFNCEAMTDKCGL